MPQQQPALSPIMQWAKNNKVRFIHLRHLDADGYFLPYGGVTVAYRPRSDGGLDVSFARCNMLDNYNKKIGRAITVGRMRHGDFYNVSRNNGEKDFDAVVNFVYKKLGYDNEELPTSEQDASTES